MQLVPAPAGIQLGAPRAPSVPLVGLPTMAKVSAALSVSAPARVSALGWLKPTVWVWLAAVGGAFGGTTTLADTVAMLESDVPSLAL